MAAKSQYYDLFDSVTSDTVGDAILVGSGLHGYALHLWGSATFAEYVAEVSIDGSNWFTYQDGGASPLPQYLTLTGVPFNWIRFTVKNISGGDVSGVASVV